jgi:hypothetical protein
MEYFGLFHVGRFSITWNLNPSQHWGLLDAEEHGAGGQHCERQHGKDLLGILGLDRGGDGG